MADIIQKIAYQGAHHHSEDLTIRCRNVSVSYSSLGGRSFTSDPAHRALKNITFQVAAGEHVAIIGPNGAGKSTLLKLLAGLLKPDLGDILLFGQAPENHICIAYVSQKNDIDNSFPATVADVVMMGRTRQIGLFRRPSKRDWAIVHRSLERVGAADLAGHQIGELSGGQQQRVFIARALAHDTDILLLDEPLTGLDLPSQQALFDILAVLRPHGVTVFLATHNLNVAADHFDRVMIVNQQMIAFGPADQVMTTDNLLAAYGGTPATHDSRND